MEVKPDYKQTDIGVIPEDWEALPVSKLGETKRGASSLCIHYKNLGGVRLIRINDFFQDNPVFVEPTDEIIKYSIHKRDLLFAGTGASAGASYLPKKEWIGLPHSYNAPRIRVFENSCKEYLLYSLQSDYVLKQQKAWFVGNAQPFLDTKAISGFIIAVPPTKAEQEDIAEVLSDADALIESLEQLLAKKRYLKQGAMQELLTGKKRLSGFSGKWKIKHLEDLADIRSGGTPSTGQSEFWDGDILWCTPTDITALNGHKYLGDTSRKISRLGLKSSSAEIIPANSIVMTSRATIGECAINHVPVSTNQGFKNFVPFEYVDVEFLYYLLLTQKQGFISLCGGSTFLEIGKTQLAAFEVRVPATKAEQTAIAAILSDMDAEITVLETKLAKARDLKQGLMQGLLTGRIRLV
jgi:type I restriction enzyme, S subunit